MRAETEVQMIAVAVLGFQSEYGYNPIPSGVDEPTIADVIPILLMDADSSIAEELNYMRIKFLDVSAHRRHEGAFMDPWGSPYRIRFAAQDSDYTEVNGTSVYDPVAVWSVGRNGKDEGGRGDDIISW